MSYSRQDVIFVKNELDKVLKEAEKYAQKDNETKKEFILRVKEKVRTLFRIEVRPVSELASYIWNLLDKINFSIARPWYESCFNDEEKRNYSTKFSTEHFIEESNGIERNPVTGQIRLNGVVYSPDLPSEVKPKTLEPKEITSPIKDKYTDLLNLIKDTFSKGETTVDAIIQRYEENQGLVQSVLEPIKDKQKQYTEYYSKIANSKDVLDDRNKWGDYEKIMARYLRDSGETIAHISKLMDYSSKFGSIGILKNKDLEDKLRQLGLCPKCKCDIYFEKNEELKQMEIKAQFEL